MKKAKITIDVERANGPLTDDDLALVAETCARVIGVDDTEREALIGVDIGDGLTWGYCVHQVEP